MLKKAKNRFSPTVSRRNASVWTPCFYYIYMASLMAQQGKESACNTGDIRDAGSNLGLGRSPGGGCGNPLQFSCLKKSTNREI